MYPLVLLGSVVGVRFLYFIGVYSPMFIFAYFQLNITFAYFFFYNIRACVLVP